MTETPFNVLVLCTGNSARSILGEAILNRLGAGRFQAYSAGSQPRGAIHPGSVAVLKSEGYEVEDLRSKSWDEFAAPDAPVIDLVVTVCDNAANEVCPVWPGAPVQVHWGFDDPAAVEGNQARQQAAFQETFDLIKSQIEKFVALPVEDLTLEELRQAVQDIAPH